jgi:hypothetical protein
VLYDTRVDYAAFQEAVIELADDGVRITKARVAERLSIEPARAGELLDRMARDNVLELDIDERTSEIFYTLSSRRPPVKASGSALAKLDEAVGAIEKAGLAAKVGGALLGGDKGPKRRKIATGVVLGTLLPGIGLAYAAPWPIVVGASIVVIAGAKIIALIPILSSFLLVPFLVVCAIASGALGGAYSWSFNQAGKRAPLGEEPTTPKDVVKRLTGKRSSGEK